MKFSFISLGKADAFLFVPGQDFNDGSLWKRESFDDDLAFDAGASSQLHETIVLHDGTDSVISAERFVERRARHRMDSDTVTGLPHNADSRPLELKLESDIQRTHESVSIGFRRKAQVLP